jgi:hypothetical protein
MNSKLAVIIIFAIALLGCTKYSSAQTTAEVKNKILIAPFNPDLYLSDAEQDIMRQTNRTPDQYREFFRKTIDLKILGQFQTVMPAYSLAQDTTQKAKRELAIFYRQCGYKYDNAKGKGINKDESKKKGISFSKKKENDIPGYITTRGDAKFMNAEITDTSFYNHLLSEYDSNYMLSVNQMEIKTNYSSCIDIANKVYRREVILHYSIYNEKGTVIDGNFLVAYFPSNSNKDTEIAERTFPELAEMLKKQLQSAIK